MATTFKFFITNVHINNGVLVHNLVFIRVIGSRREEILTFNTYELAEAWINEERRNGSTHIYQIQKVYLA